jgi:hypothetical protein
MNKRSVLITVLALSLLSPSCVKRQAVSQAMVIKLTKAMQGVSGAAQLTDEQMLAAINKQDPELQKGLKKSVVQTKRDGDNLLILVCSPDGKVGLYEDASWTLKVDRKWSKTERNHPCAWDRSLDFRNAQAASK